ncbi:MAG: Lrp/AsnC family transcriptional regulator [Leptothrix sp. (in: b-proteobacteria)]
MDQTPIALDATDRRILVVLQKNGRITFDELAREVQLSSSAALRRVRRLEESGVIAGYAAIVPPEQLGLGLIAYIHVRLEKQPAHHKRNPMDLFRTAVQNWPEVTECVTLSSEMAHLLRVAVTDMQHYTRFMFETLLKHPSVQDCQTDFVLDRVKGCAVVPLSPDISPTA